MKKFLVTTSIFSIILLVSIPLFGVLYQGSDFSTWDYIINHSKTHEAIIGSITVAMIAVLINILIGTPVGAYLGKETTRYSKVLEFLMIMPIIIPGFITSMGIQYLFIKLGIIDTYIGVGIVHGIMGFPYFIRSISTGYKLINRGYERMGKIFGASHLNIFFKINLPMLIPAFVAGVSLVIVVSFAQYLITLIIGGGRIVTIPIIMLPFMAGGDLKVGGVYSILYIVVNLILLLVLEQCIKKAMLPKEEKNKNCGENIR